MLSSKEKKTVGGAERKETERERGGRTKVFTKSPHQQEDRATAFALPREQTLDELYGSEDGLYQFATPLDVPDQGLTIDMHFFLKHRPFARIDGHNGCPQSIVH